MDSRISKEKILSNFIISHPQSASVVLMKSPPAEIAQFIASMPINTLSTTLALLPMNLLEEVLSLLSNDLISKVLTLLDVNLVRTVIYQWILRGRVDAKRIEEISNSLEPNFAKALKKLLKYPADSIGSIMNPTPFSVSENLTTGEVLSILKKEKNRFNRFIYITNDTSSLHGVVSFKDLFYAKSDTLLSTIMSSDVFYFRPTDSIEETYQNLEWKNWDTIPIVDIEKKLVGLIKFKKLEKEVYKDQYRASTKNQEISQAGEAINEIFQIGLAATLSALMIPVKGSKK